MADVDLTAELAEIRDRAGVFAKLGPQRSAEPARGIGAESVNAGYGSAADVPRLLAAVEAVLELAGEAQQVDTGGTWIPCWDLDPAEVREVISREITGKEESGA